ncbi:MAG TPA: hypothetical protein VLH15_08555, partial [Dehalococcoidales bacterium]|nr:hypothetical protein [Dehalococcoidales bacterium]
CKLAALIWLLMEQRSSLLVAAGPSFAGKSTLLHALLDFLPPGQEKINLRGYFEDFHFLSYSSPDSSYLVTEEISNHSYDYLWGVKAQRAFNLLPKGYPLGGTIHARTAEEAIWVLNNWLGIPVPVISRLGVIVVLRARAGRNMFEDPVRRINSVSLVSPATDGLTLQTLAARRFTERGFDYQSEQTLQAAINTRFPALNCSFKNEVEFREHYLRHLRKKDKITRIAVRKAVVEYYRTVHK